MSKWRPYKPNNDSRFFIDGKWHLHDDIAGEIINGKYDHLNMLVHCYSIGIKTYYLFDYDDGTNKDNFCVCVCVHMCGKCEINVTTKFDYRDAIASSLQLYREQLVNRDESFVMLLAKGIEALIAAKFENMNLFIGRLANTQKRVQ